MAGISKQAFHKYNQLKPDYSLQIQSLVNEADLLRQQHPGCGVTKIYDTLQPDWIGRINAIRLLYEYGFKLRRKINYRRTTLPVSSLYCNLIEGMIVNNKNQVWQSDITYYKVGSQFYYLVFIVDVYTRQIIGYHVSDNMRAEGNLKALTQAIEAQHSADLTGLIHHSDRGSQYISVEYIEALEDKGIWISVGKCAYQNAYAERINGIIKNEFLKGWSINNLIQLQRKVKTAVKYYNSKRIHRSLPKYQCPEEFARQLVHLTTQNRPTVIIYTEGNKKLKATSRCLEFYPETEPRAPICPMVI